MLAHLVSFPLASRYAAAQLLHLAIRVLPHPTTTTTSLAPRQLAWPCSYPVSLPSNNLLTPSRSSQLLCSDV